MGVIPVEHFLVGVSFFSKKVFLALLAPEEAFFIISVAGDFKSKSDVAA